MLAVLLFVVAAMPASAQAAFSARYTNTATNGDIVLIGNVNFHCSTSNPPATAAQITTCNSARTAGNLTATNNNVYMVPVDTDSNAATTNSSSATLGMQAGSSVLFAGLYWTGISSSATNRSTAVFSTPLSTSTVTATTTAVIGSNNTYQSFVNVTSLVQAGGNGVYTVGNIASTQGAGSWAGWTLVVAYRNTALPTRNLAVFDGLLQANNAATPVDITVSGFLTPSSGTVNSTIGVVAYDGDAGAAEGTSASPPGSLKFGASTTTLSTVSNAVNPVNDVFNSSISARGAHVTAGRTPAYTNTLGVDIDTFTPNTPLPNGSTSAVVRVTGTSGDVIYPGIITLATEIFVPNIKDALTKTVTDVNGGALLPGDVLEYELTVKNQGNDGALNVLMTDAIPAGTTYVPGSLSVTGLNAGAKSDAAGDDQAEFDAGGNRVVARLGVGATATAGGSIAPGQETHLIFRVTVNASTPADTVVSNTGTVSYRQQTLGTTVTDASDSDPAVDGDQPARITVSTPDLRVDKFRAGVFPLGGSGVFTLRVSNAGPAPSVGTVTVTDTLPAGMTAQAISGSGWTCTLSPLACTTTAVVAAGSALPDVNLTVTAPAGTYTNTASVSGGGEGSAVRGNNSDSDTVTVPSLPLPNVVVGKTVENLNGTGGATTSNGARPGDVLEYCVTFSNSGGPVGPVTLRDTLPGTVQPLTSGYGGGLGLELTVNAVTTTLTSAADADAGSLVGQAMTLAVGTLSTSNGGRVCLRARVL